MGFTEDRNALKLLRLQDSIDDAKRYASYLRNRPGYNAASYLAEKEVGRLEAKLEKLLSLRS